MNNNNNNNNKVLNKIYNVKAISSHICLDRFHKTTIKVFCIYWRENLTLNGSALLFFRNWLYIHQSICYKWFPWSNSKWHTECFPYSQQVALPPTLLRWSKESNTGSPNFAPSPQNTAAALLHIFSFYLGKVMTSLLSPSSTAPTVLMEAQT